MSTQGKLGVPPVEALSEVAWARVERGLWTQLDHTQASSEPSRRSRRWLWLTVPALAAAALIMLMVHGTSPRDAANDTLDRVVSGAAPSSISFGDSHIELAANSAVIMNREGPSVILENGAAWFTVAPRAGRSPFVVLAGDTVVRVVGTRFQVTRDHERASVHVDHGVVEVRFHGEHVRLGASQAWSSDQPAIATTVELPSAQPDLPEAIEIDPPRPTGRAATETPASTSRAPANPKTSDRDQFQKLTSLEASDPKTALAGYLELARGTGRWSAVALYAAARLAVERNDSRAEDLLSSYLRRFPHGANVVDAEELLDRVKRSVP